jgi:hypothetical protein
MTAFSKRIWILPIIIFGIAWGIYWLSAVLLGRVRSPDTAYFNYLADAFLRSRLYLANPPQIQDLTQYGGKWYVPFPPLPALLLLPWVALSGVEKVNTVLFGAIIGAANVVLAFLLLQSLAKRGWTRLGLTDNLWLTLLFGIGTVHWYMATLGSVWFISQLCTLSFILAAAWSAVATGSPILSGTALALAMLGRPHVVLCYPFLLAIGIQHSYEQMGSMDVRQCGTWAILSLAPLVLSGALLLGYNYARFDNALDFGYLRQNVAPELVADLHMYGQFNLHYVPHNLWAMLLAGPHWDAAKNQIVPTIDGMSLLLTTPALVYLLEARQRSALVLGAWLAFGLLLIPLVSYYNTGWWQFGYRFSLDFMTPVFVLLAVGAGARVGWKMRLLILLGVLVNAWGVWWFLNPRFFS